MSGAQRIVKMIAVTSTVAVLAACGGGDDQAGPPATEESTPVVKRSEAFTEGFPEGAFEHTATVAEAMENGFTKQEAGDAFGADGELPMTFVFDSGGYQHVVVDDDGNSEVGDLGTYTVDGGKVIMVSESAGCPGCVETYRWTFDGETLALELLGSNAGEADFQDTRLHTAYHFQKV